MPHHRHLAGFWILLRFWIWQSFKYARITQDYEKTLHYRYLTGFWMCLLVFKWLSYKELWVLCKLYSRDSRYFEYTQILDMPRFWMHQQSQYARFSQGILTEFLKYLGFWICQSSESVLETTLTLNSKGKLQKVRCLTCIWPETWNLEQYLFPASFWKEFEK